jgi:hypothetical protein
MFLQYKKQNAALFHESDELNALKMNLPAENLGYPYYFILDVTMRVTNVFVPDKGCTKVSKWYMEEIRERFFNQKYVW